MFLTCLYKGGISFRLQTQGFGADTVCNYEVVLANGSIVEANKDSHTDPFWALRLASANFGIVTCLDMRTYVLPVIWEPFPYPVSNQTLSKIFGIGECMHGSAIKSNEQSEG